MNPWEVLGIPEGTDDAREVRRAYAARVREHPPDEDPDGFRRVREAYELILAQGGGRGRGEPDAADDAPAPRQPLLSEREERTRPPVEGAEPDPALLLGRRPPPERPAEPRAPPGRRPLDERRRREREAPDEEPIREDALGEVRAAAALVPGPGRDGRLRNALLSLGDRMRTDRRLVPHWSAAVLGTFDDPKRPELIASVARAGDLVLDLFEARGEVTARVLPLLRDRRGFERLVRIARAVAGEPGEPRNDVSSTLAFLAASVAIVAPGIAKALADRAFRTAARKDDAGHEGLDLDRRIAAGREVEGETPEVVAFLAASADGLPWDRKADRAIARKAFDVVARLQRNGAARRLLRNGAPGLVAAADDLRRRRERKQSSSGSGGRWIMAVLGILILIRACSSFITENPPAIYRNFERRNVDIEELRRKYGLPPRPQDRPPDRR